MRSKQLDLSKYDSDKINNCYLKTYDTIFAPLINEKINLLEIGVLKGGSLLLWRDYFNNATVTGIDLSLPEDFGIHEKIHLFKGSQADTSFLSSVSNSIAPEGFDIIIDDASHIGQLTKVAFWHLFDNHLKSGGLYVIEDWGTGYWDDWPDGMSVNAPKSFFSKFLSRFDASQKNSFPSSNSGMVGFIKELVDEQGAADLTRLRMSGRPTRLSKFESLLITPSIVFVRKAVNE